MPQKLPFTLKVRRASVVGDHIDVDCVITDAKGDSVQSLPILTSAKRSFAEICSMLQHQIDEITRVAHENKRAELPDVASADELVEELSELVGREFIGSVVQ